MSEEESVELRQIAGEIVASYLSNNQMAAEQVPSFIKDVMRALQEDVPATTAPEPQKPAVPIRRSVREDAVVCLECGAAQKTLKRHVQIAHALSESEYRDKWNLPKDHPLVAPSYSKARSSMARKIGLGKRGAGGRKSKAS